MSKHMTGDLWNDYCSTCQGSSRETTDMVCMTCGRDYMSDNPVPGLGWKRLMGEWEAYAKKLEAELDVRMYPRMEEIETKDEIL